jgi:hypothetical protein
MPAKVLCSCFSMYLWCSAQTCRGPYSGRCWILLPLACKQQNLGRVLVTDQRGRPSKQRLSHCVGSWHTGRPAGEGKSCRKSAFLPQQKGLWHFLGPFLIQLSGIGRISSRPAAAAGPEAPFQQVTRV